MNDYPFADYNAFLKIVKERPDWKIKSKPKCPYCDSKKIKSHGATTTLVGGKSNHIWERISCLDCGEDSDFEIKERGELREIRWYTDSSRKKVLKGIPGCFETYIYTCNKCDGDVKRHQLETESDEPVKILCSGPDENGLWIHKYRIVFKCDDCSQSVESRNEYYFAKPPRKMTYQEEVTVAKEREAKSREAMKKWKIVEEPGIVVLSEGFIAATTNETIPNKSSGNELSTEIE